MPRWEATQIILGLAIPFFLFPHIVNTRIAHSVFKVEDSYLYEFVRLWPESAAVQSLLLVFVWVHGCLGLHYWLRLSDGYQKALPVLRVLAAAIPVLALAGFAAGAQTASDIMSDPEAMAALKARSNWPNADDSGTLASLRLWSRIGFFSLVAVATGIGVLRWLSRTAGGRKVRVSYAGGPTVVVPAGETLLEISRSRGVAHASVCGGRGRCSTCRVRIEQGLDRLSPPTGAEALTLRSIEAPANVRLACQIRPTADLTVALISRPATPGPPQDGFTEIKEFVAAHVRGILGGCPADMQTADAAAAQRWLATKVEWPVPVRDLASHAFVFRGARIDFVLDQPVAALIYERQGRIVTLFEIALRSAHSLAMRGHHNSYHVLSWEDDAAVHVAVSDMPVSELAKLEIALSPPVPPLRANLRAAAP